MYQILARCMLLPKNKLLLSSLLLFFFIPVMAQESISVSGRVIDNNTRNGIPSVNISVKGGKIGAVTDVNGSFRINVPRGATLVFSSVGYSAQEQIIAGTEPLTIVLNSQANNLSEVIVIGYGERRKKDVTGAISSVGSKEIEKSTALSPELAM